MNTQKIIPVLPGKIAGQTTQLVEARRLHAFLGVGRDFSNWIKGRIAEYHFEQNQDYLLAKSGDQVPHQRGWRTAARIDYFVCLDMAKELAMVERTPQGRAARRYFIDCERQLRQMQHNTAHGVPLQRLALSPGQRQAINRQAWADVSGAAQEAFYARREVLVQACVQNQSGGLQYLPVGFVPEWAR